MELVKTNDYGKLNKMVGSYLDMYSENTKKSYLTDIKDFLDNMKINIYEMNEKDVLSYIKLLEERNIKNSTFNRKIYSLQKICEIFVRNNLMKSNPVKRIREIKKIDKPVVRETGLNITIDDVKTVIEQTKDTISFIILFLINSGCRIGEMINITYQDIEDFNETYKKIKITGKGNKDRFIYIKIEILNNIKKVYHHSSKYLFHTKSGNQLDKSNLYKQVVKSFNDIGKSSVNPHKLRHLFCQYKINDEKQDIKSVSLYVGHSSVNITLDYYCNNRLLPEQTDII